MNISVIDSDTAALLSLVTNHDLSKRDLCPTLVFLAALCTVLLGVAVIDQQVHPSEEQRLQVLLESLVLPRSHLYALIREMIGGIETYQVYLNPNQLQQLAAPLSESERLMVVGLGYELAAADGEIDLREILYLRAIAQRFRLHPRHWAVLEAGLRQQPVMDVCALTEVRTLLDPLLFQSFELVLAQIARKLLALLPTPPSTMETYIPSLVAE